MQLTNSMHLQHDTKALPLWGDTRRAVPAGELHHLSSNQISELTGEQDTSVPG